MVTSWQASWTYCCFSKPCSSFEGSFPTCQAVSVLGGRVDQIKGGLSISVGSGLTLPHQVPDASALNQCMDVFSGIGCLGTGLEAAGFSIQPSVDISGPLCQFLSKQSRSEVIEGNLGERSTLQALHTACKGSVLIAGGFSCQPWSTLGDQHGVADARASSLRHILQAAWFLRASSLVLECVVGAGRDPVVMTTLKHFCQVTHFRLSTQELALEQIMPAKRNRWWCTMTHPSIPAFQLRDMPKLQVPPVVSDMLPIVPQWEAKDLDQLRLDRYDSGKFEAYGGILNSLVQGNKPLQTALHGWSNQLMACPCLCRGHAMSEKRLQAKGLFGALFMLEGTFDSAYQQLPCTRHIHPIELALLHGMRVDYEWGDHMRLALCGLGQMASPVQSCWISSQVKAQQDTALGLPVSTPEMALASHFQGFFASVAQVLPAVSAHPNFQRFVANITDALRCSHLLHVGPMPTPAIEDENKNESTSQRGGRKDLFKCQDVDKQPAAGMQEPLKWSNSHRRGARTLQTANGGGVRTPTRAKSPKWTHEPCSCHAGTPI